MFYVIVGWFLLGAAANYLMVAAKRVAGNRDGIRLGDGFRFIVLGPLGFLLAAKALRYNLRFRARNRG